MRTLLSFLGSTLAVKSKYPFGVMGSALAVKSQYPVGGHGVCTGSQEPVPLWGSWGLHWQSRASTPVGVMGSALAVKSQYPSGGHGVCSGSQEPVPLWVVQGAALAVKGQHPGGGDHRGCTVSELLGALRPVNHYGYIRATGLYWQSEWEGGGGGCTGNNGPVPLSGSRRLH